MPKARSHTAAGAVATNKESLSSASQLSAFGVRLAKVTHRVSADGAANFATGITLPASSFVLSVSADVSEAYAGGTATTVTVEGQALTINAAAVVGAAVNAAATAGELTLTFDATDSTAGEMTVAVAYIDLSEIK